MKKDSTQQIIKTSFNLKQNSKIYIAGHQGMVGSACLRLLKRKGYNQLIYKTKKELDLTKQNDVADFFKHETPKAVIAAAAKVGGIWANNEYPYDFLMSNMLIQNNLIKAALENGVEKFIFLGSSCIYPRMSNQPIKEEYLLEGQLEKSNQWYAISKISGVKLIESIRRVYKKDYVSLMPTNMYGPNDNYDLEKSHVLPALIRKFHEAKVKGDLPVVLWGSGEPLREFLHVDDLASAIFFLLKSKTHDNIYNVGSGEEISIKNLSLIVQKIVGHKGLIVWDDSKPDGTPRKLLNSSRLNSLGWKHEINLHDGVKKTYSELEKNNFIF